MKTFKNENITITFDEKKYILLVSSSQMTNKKINALLLAYQRSEEIEGGPSLNFSALIDNNSIIIEGNLCEAVKGLYAWKLIDNDLQLRVLQCLKEIALTGNEAQTNVQMHSPSTHTLFRTVCRGKPYKDDEKTKLLEIGNFKIEKNNLIV